MIHNRVLINCNTPIRDIQTGPYKIIPIGTPGIQLNGVEACIQNVIYAHDRVDLAYNGKRVYLVEHTLALCALFGIHSARIDGNQGMWDFSRLSHRDAESFGHLPSDVFGEPTGEICSTDFKEPPKCIANQAQMEFLTIHHEVHFTDAMGTIITLHPPSFFPKILISCSAENRSLDVNMDICSGMQDFSLIKKLLCARSPAVVSNWNDESIMHATADIIADIVWLGRIAADMEIKLGPYYHRATVGIGKKIIDLTYKGDHK